MNGFGVNAAFDARPARGGRGAGYMLHSGPFIKEIKAPKAGSRRGGGQRFQSTAF
ncbi:hypothetical protein JL100_028195 [Skermanella mucosa]|uniref:hypothetical protein n=1 Tax=Skermanella mucosa TaxID=1789672 RepID=UPI001E54DFDD|nr:hypothetical protein [Skermanella mucosa]UEM20902.1 hypothetical protein JL100_028195 [Skermanella mucosa]